jgi:hypothetical protein
MKKIILSPIFGDFAATAKIAQPLKTVATEIIAQK